MLAYADRLTVEDAKAAMDASESRNHSFFKDRNHSGKMNWEYA
jgi:hypothetical protein